MNGWFDNESITSFQDRHGQSCGTGGVSLPIAYTFKTWTQFWITHRSVALCSSLRTPAPTAILCLTRTCMGLQTGRPYCTTVIAILKSTHQAFVVRSNILASHQVTYGWNREYTRCMRWQIFCLTSGCPGAMSSIKSWRRLCHSDFVDSPGRPTPECLLNKAAVSQ